MSEYISITIARQYGSGGREIGEKAAKLLGFKIYDKELITMAAKDGKLDEDILAEADEKAANSLLYTLAMGSNVYGLAHTFGFNVPINDQLFVLQSNAIKEAANQDNAVFIGRCADYVLRDKKKLVRIFIYSNTEARKSRIAQRHPELKPGAVIDLMSKTDKRRASYYNFYTGKKWGKYENYDLAINSASFGIDACAKAIADFVKEKFSI